MISRKVSLLVLISILFLTFAACDDDSTGPKRDDDATFIYGLIETSRMYNNPEEVYHNVFARVLNNPDYENISGEYSKDGVVREMEVNQNLYSTYLNYVQPDSELNIGDIWQMKISDSEHEYSGSIEVLPYCVFTNYDLTDNILSLEWNDNGADFYEIVFDYSTEPDERFIVTEANSFLINLNDLNIVDQQEIYILIYAYKGFNPLEKSTGNIDGCRGYFFSYSRYSMLLNLGTMVFSIPDIPRYDSSLENRLLDFAHGNYESSKTSSYNDIKFMYTYAYLVVPRHNDYDEQSFISFTYLEPVGVLETIQAQVNDIIIASTVTKNYSQIVTDNDTFIPEYNPNIPVTYTLSLNDVSDNASISYPDTFSVINYPESDEVPTSPLQIDWRRPLNADFFYVEAEWWSDENNSYDYEYHFTQDTSFVFTDIPDSLGYWMISVLAVSGSNPLLAQSPNLVKHNGYFYSIRLSQNVISSESYLQSINNTGKSLDLDRKQIQRFENLLKKYQFDEVESQTMN